MGKPNKETKKKKAFQSPYSFSGHQGLDMDSLARKAAADPSGFMALAQELIDSGELRLGNIRNGGRFFERTNAIEIPVSVPYVNGQRASVMASAFPVLISGMMIAEINEAYEGVPTIGEELVMEMDSNQRDTTIANILSHPVSSKGVDEGTDYPLISFGDEKFQIGHRRDGARFSVTGELVEETNGLAQLARLGRELGDMAAENIEELTLARVQDVTGSGASPAAPFALTINGAGAALYRTNNNTPLGRLPTAGNRVTNNALEDTGDLENARARLAGMKNSRGKVIAYDRANLVLLVPDALSDRAWRLLNSEMEPGVENEANKWGPRGMYRPRIITSPKLDQFSTGAWYLGNFKKQFTRKWKLRLEMASIMSAAQVTQAWVNSRELGTWRVGWDCEVGATDYVHVVQCLAATTPPTVPSNPPAGA